MPDYIVDKGEIFERRPVTKRELREQLDMAKLEEDQCVEAMKEIRARKALIKELLESPEVTAIND